MSAKGFGTLLNWKKPDGLNNTAACHRYIGQIGVGPGPQRYRGGRSQGCCCQVERLRLMKPSIIMIIWYHFLYSFFLISSCFFWIGRRSRFQFKVPSFSEDSSGVFCFDSPGWILQIRKTTERKSRNYYPGFFFTANSGWHSMDMPKGPRLLQLKKHEHEKSSG